MSGVAQSGDGGAGQDAESDGEPPHEAHVQGGLEEVVEEEEEPAAKQPRLQQEDVALDFPMIEIQHEPSEEKSEIQGAAGIEEEGEAIVI